MFRKGSFVLAALALMVAAPMAHAHDCSLSIGGGVAIPTGDFSDNTSGLDAALGYMITPEFDYHVNDKFAIGVDGTWGSNSLNSDDRDAIRTANSDPSFDVKYTQMGGGVHGKLMMPMQNGPLSPYLVAGAGMTNFKAKVESDDPLVAGDRSKTGFAGRVGIGAGYKAGSQTSIGVEGDYNFVSLKKDDFGVSSAPSLGVKAVVTFMFKGATK
jgi:opacity protein-like surface antigen